MSIIISDNIGPLSAIIKLIFVLVCVFVTSSVLYNICDRVVIMVYAVFNKIIQNKNIVLLADPVNSVAPFLDFVRYSCEISWRIS